MEDAIKAVGEEKAKNACMHVSSAPASLSANMLSHQ